MGTEFKKKVMFKNNILFKKNVQIHINFGIIYVHYFLNNTIPFFIFFLKMMIDRQTPEKN